MRLNKNATEAAPIGAHAYNVGGVDVYLYTADPLTTADRLAAFIKRVTEAAPEGTPETHATEAAHVLFIREVWAEGQALEWETECDPDALPDGADLWAIAEGLRREYYSPRLPRLGIARDALGRAATWAQNGLTPAIAKGLTSGEGAASP